MVGLAGMRAFTTKVGSGMICLSPARPDQAHEHRTLWWHDEISIPFLTQLLRISKELRPLTRWDVNGPINCCRPWARCQPNSNQTHLGSRPRLQKMSMAHHQTHYRSKLGIQVNLHHYRQHIRAIYQWKIFSPLVRKWENWKTWPTQDERPIFVLFWHVDRCVINFSHMQIRLSGRVLTLMIPVGWQLALGVHRG